MRPQVMHKVFFIVVLMGTSDSWNDFVLPQIGHQTDTRDVNRQPVNYKRHPCIAGNGTVLTDNGLILCLVLTEKELKTQLRAIGGLNRHYVAVTKEEADKFANLISSPRPTLPAQQQETKQFPIIWSYLSSGASHRKKIVSHNVKPESSNSKTASRKQKTVPHNFKSASRNSKNMLSSEDLSNNIISSKKSRCVYSGAQTEYGMFRLCTECQKISKLKSDRFPRYINEVACDNKIPNEMGHSVGCHRNQGMRIQRFLFTDFLVRTEKYGSRTRRRFAAAANAN